MSKLIVYGTGRGTRSFLFTCVVFTPPLRSCANHPRVGSARELEPGPTSPFQLANHSVLVGKLYQVKSLWTGKRASSKPASWNCLVHCWRLGCRRERRWSNYSRPSRASTGSTHVKKRLKNMRALCAPSAGETPRCDLCRQSPDERLATATALLAMLDSASECHGGEEAMDAFLRLGGPSILRFRLDSMDGLVQCLITARAPALRLFVGSLVPLLVCVWCVRSDPQPDRGGCKYSRIKSFL